MGLFSDILSWLNSRCYYWLLLHVGQGRDTAQHSTVPTTLAPENKLASVVLKETPARGSDRGAGEEEEEVLGAHRKLSSGPWEERPDQDSATWHVPQRQGLVQ